MDEEIKRVARYEYPDMDKKMGTFSLSVCGGEFTDSEIIVMLGENGTGKTTFIRMLAGRLAPDGDNRCPVLNVSYKPQKISPKSQKTVVQLLHEKIRDSVIHPQFITDVIKPLQLERLYDQEVRRVEICLKIIDLKVIWLWFCWNVNKSSFFNFSFYSPGIWRKR